MNRLYKSTTDRKLSGLCGGIAETYGFDPTLVRLAFVFLLIFTGFVPMILLYIAGMIIVPDRPSQNDGIIK